MAFPYKIPAHATVEFDGAPYRFQGELGGGRLHFMHMATGAPLQVPDADTGEDALPTSRWFSDMLRSGRIVIKGPPLANAVRQIARDAEWDAAAIHEIDPLARLRYAVVSLLDEQGVPNGIKAITLGLTALWTSELRAEYGPSPNPHTIKRWRSSRGAIGDRKLRDMVSMTGKVARAKRLPRVVHEVIQKHALKHYTAGGNIQDAWAEIAVEIGRINEGLHKDYARSEIPYKLPSHDTVRLAVRALEGSDTFGAKHGPNAVRSRYRGAGKPITASRALELGIVDHTPIPAYFVIDPDQGIPLGSPWLTANVDVHTRAITGWLVTFESPSLWSVAEVIRRSNRPKRVSSFFAARYPGLETICGKHSELIVDNGSEFVGHGLEDGAADVGIGIRFCPVGEPQYKAMGERFFRTLPDYLVSKLPGVSYDIGKMREFGYDPSKHAVVTLEELESALAAAIAYYHVTPHGGLNEQQPLLMWNKSVARHGIDLIGNDAELDTAIGNIKMGVTLSKSGIDLFGLDYGDHRLVPELLDDLACKEPRRRKTKNPTATVKVKYNPLDIAQIHVWNRVTRKYVTLTCDIPEYAEGMPLWLHRRVRAMAKAEANAFNTLEERLAARAHVIDIIRDISGDAKKRERKLLARLYEIPRLRAITGEILSVHEEDTSPSGMVRSVRHDIAAPNRLDSEILSSRARRGRKLEDRDRRDAGRPLPHHSANNATTARPSSNGSQGKPSRPRNKANGRKGGPFIYE